MYAPTTVTVEDVWYNPASNKVIRNFFEVPDEYEPPKTDARVKNFFRDPKRLGRETNLPRSQYLAVLLYRNEIQACMGRAADKHGLLRSLRKEYPEWEFKKAQNYFRSFANFRNRFNRAELFEGQPMPTLYCWTYSAHGYIINPIRRTMVLSFDWCKRHLKQERFMDPRFFPLATIQEAHELNESNNAKYQNWNIPLLADIQRLEDFIGKPLYGSVPFPPGFNLRG